MPNQIDGATLASRLVTCETALARIEGDAVVLVFPWKRDDVVAMSSSELLRAAIDHGLLLEVVPSGTIVVRTPHAEPCATISLVTLFAARALAVQAREAMLSASQCEAAGRIIDELNDILDPSWDDPDDYFEDG